MKRITDQSAGSGPVELDCLKSVAWLAWPKCLAVLNSDLTLGGLEGLTLSYVLSERISESGAQWAASPGAAAESRS